LADLDQYGIKKYPRYKTGFEKLMEDLGGASTETKNHLIQAEIGTEFYAILKQFQSIMQQKGVQARMPFTLDIR
jgi:protease-4